MKRFAALAITALALFTLVGCRAGTPESAPAPAESTNAESAPANAGFDLDRRDRQSAPADAAVKRYSCPAVYANGGENPLTLNGFADTGDSLLLFYGDNTNLGFELYGLDKASGESDLIKQLAFDEETALYSAVYADGLLWFSTCGTGGWSIYSLSPESGELCEAANGSAADFTAPNLAAGGGKVGWFCIDGDSASYVIYDAASGTETVVENVLPTYETPCALGTAYAIDEDGRAVVCYDGKRVDTGADPEGFMLIAANGGRVAWRYQAQSGFSAIYLLDEKSGGVYGVHTYRYMGGGFLGKYFYVHTSDGELWLYDAEAALAYTLKDCGAAWAYTAENTVGTFSWEENCVYSAELY